MGITKQHAIMLIKEAEYKPLPETIHLIGRQTIYMDEQMTLNTFKEKGFKPKDVGIKIDQETGGARQDKKPYITDSTFFHMIGADNIRSIDISNYEGADIILDLNRPIPEDQENISDFIFGGSVCDNVFDPAMYLRNICRLLKPGGRYLSQEIASNHYHPYVVLPPSWHFDYFVINRFVDIKVYVFDIKNIWNVYCLDPDLDYKFLPNYTAPNDHTLGVFIIAEKGQDSTWDRSPTQEQYRSAGEWAEYRESLKRIKSSPRPVIPFRMPVIESALDMLPPQFLPCYRYLGRF